MEELIRNKAIGIVVESIEEKNIYYLIVKLKSESYHQLKTTISLQEISFPCLVCSKK
jgi:hypothetical protein